MAQRRKAGNSASRNKTSCNAKCLTLPRITSLGAAQRAQRRGADSSTCAATGPGLGTGKKSPTLPSLQWVKPSLMVCHRNSKRLIPGALSCRRHGCPSPSLGPQLGRCFFNWLFELGAIGTGFCSFSSLGPLFRRRRRLGTNRRRCSDFRHLFYFGAIGTGVFAISSLGPLFRRSGSFRANRRRCFGFRYFGSLRKSSGAGQCQSSGH